MCTNRKEIYNKYIKRTMYVDCGKCDACLQQKANQRMTRILSHAPSGYVPLFFHLTYAPEYVPFIYMEDLQVCDGSQYGNPLISVYRHNNVRWYYNRHNQSYSKLYNDEEHWLCDYEYNHCTEYELNKLYNLGDNTCAVLYYPDVQNFFKRLRQNLIRNEQYKEIFNESNRLSYFACGEYGETNSRCHWHIILYVPQLQPEKLYLWKDVISRSWLFAREDITRNKVEFAIAAASYASSYVNMSSDISSFFQNKDFRPRWYWSKNFGFDYDSFTLPSLLSSIEKNDLRFLRKIVKADGTSRIKCYPLPTYVTGRWFPRFKGFSRLNYEQIGSIIRDPTELYRTELQECLNITSMEAYNMILSIKRHAYRFNKACFSSRFDGIKPTNFVVDVARNFVPPFSQCALHQYSYWYVRFLQALNSTKFKYQYDDLEMPFDCIQRYDNIKEYSEKKPILFYRSFGLLVASLERYSDLLPHRSCTLTRYIVDTNKFLLNVNKTDFLSKQFRDKIKKRKVNQLCHN